MNTSEFYQNILNLDSKLKYYAYSFTSNREEAQDLLQETFLKAITHQEMFVQGTNFAAWLYTIMRNIYINNYKKNKIFRTVVDNSKDSYIHPGQQSEIPVDSAYSIVEIKRNINILKEEFRVPFKLYTLGHKYKEIAEKLGVPIGTVKSRIFFARKCLMKILKDYRYTDAA